MDWSNEIYIRLYVRDTATWVRWPWQAKCTFTLLLRKVDRHGVLDLDGGGAETLAALIGLPLEVVEAGLPALTRPDKRGGRTVEFTEDRVGLPNFVAAQEAKASDAKRCRDYRERMKSKLDTPNDTKRVADDTQSVSPTRATDDATRPTGTTLETDTLSFALLSFAQQRSELSLRSSSAADDAAASPTAGGRVGKRVSSKGKPDIDAATLDPKARLALEAIAGDETLAPICPTPATLARDLVNAAPGVAVAIEIKRAGAWLRANPTRRKSQGSRFLTAWLGRAQERSRGTEPTNPAPTAEAIAAAERQAQLQAKADASIAALRMAQEGAVATTPLPPGVPTSERPVNGRVGASPPPGSMPAFRAAEPNPLKAALDADEGDWRAANPCSLLDLHE